MRFLRPSDLLQALGAHPKMLQEQPEAGECQKEAHLRGAAPSAPAGRGLRIMRNVKHLRQEWLDRLNALYVVATRVPGTGEMAQEQAVELGGLVELVRGTAERYASAERRESSGAGGLS